MQQADLAVEELGSFLDNCEGRLAQWEQVGKDEEEGILGECETTINSWVVAGRHHLDAGKTAVMAKTKLMETS